MAGRLRFVLAQSESWMRRLAALLLLGAACGTSEIPAARDAGDGGGGNTSVDASDERPLSCNGAAGCAKPADCAVGGQGDPGCWMCVGACCVAVPETTDPFKACAKKGSACVRATCDGRGACSSPTTLRDGTPCGSVCGGAFVFAHATCANGVCRGEPSSQTSCADVCHGDYTGCDTCDGTGCVASCSALPAHPDRCWP